MAAAAPGQDGKGRVLVTGVSGFVGLHVAKACADAGYDVRGTVRPGCQQREAILAAVPSVELTEVSLDASGEAWVKAAEGCTLCAHVASPFPLVTPEDEDELIKPAVEGTVKVLEACKAAGIVRVVLTSSVAAVSGGADGAKRDFTSADWTDVERVEAYPKSKTLAERAAREYANNNGLELCTVNPSYVQGPVLQPRENSSTRMCARLLEGSLPVIPKIGINMCDVRDVAEAHVKALQSGKPGGRYLVDSGTTMMTAVATELRKKLGHLHNVKTTPAPWFLMKVVSLWDAEVGAVMPRWNKVEHYDSAETIELLGRPLRSTTDCVLSMAASLSDFGMVTRKRGAPPPGEASAAAAAAAGVDDSAE
mmetsp:Transcript_3639/g.11402  ORF Transcript_3639/g.11402 Transcript_3639/m.11402 type:complete len:365 (+) Transcript_3639:75-1169(+)